MKRKKAKVKTMARRSRRIGRRARRSHSSGGRFSGLMPIIGGAIYGVARPYLNQMAQPLMDKMPFGNYNNEVLMGGSATIVKMLVKNKMVSDLLTPVQIIEAASATETAMRSVSGGNNAQSSMMFY